MKPYYRVYDPKEYATHGDKFDCAHNAEQLALELATKYPGSVFEILRCVGYSSTSKASTFWMDGEEPPEKPRYRMLEIGDEVIDGDQYEKVGVPGLWVTTSSTGYRLSCYNAPHRRPL